jgi:hypothetical protein
MDGEVAAAVAAMRRAAEGSASAVAVPPPPPPTAPDSSAPASEATTPHVNVKVGPDGGSLLIYSDSDTLLNLIREKTSPEKRGDKAHEIVSHAPPSGGATPPATVKEFCVELHCTADYLDIVVARIAEQIAAIRDSFIAAVAIHKK